MSLLTDLIFSYELDGTYADAHGTVTDLTPSGSPVFGVSGIVDNTEALDLESGSNQYASHASTSDFQVTGSFSVQVWVKFESIPAYDIQIVSKDQVGNREYGLYYRQSDSRFRFASNLVQGALNEAVANSFGAVSLGVWYLVTGTYNTTTGVTGISVNDGPIDTVSNTPGLPPTGTSTEFRIGTREYTSFLDPFDGLIQCVRMWKNRVLTYGDIVELYNEGDGLPYMALQHGAKCWEIAREVWAAATRTEGDFTDISGCKLLLMSDRITGLNDGDAVGTWEDTSGQNNDPTATSGNRPTYQTNELNSLSVVRFDGTDDEMGTGSCPVSGVDATLFLVCNPSNIDSGRAPLMIGDEASNNGYGLATSTSPGQTVGRLRAGVAWDGTTVAAATGAAVYSMVQSTGFVELFKGGISLGTILSVTPNTPTTRAALGNHQFGVSTTYAWAGDIASVIVYDSDLSDPDRESVDFTLGGKYGIGAGTPEAYMIGAEIWKYLTREADAAGGGTITILLSPLVMHGTIVSITATTGTTLTPTPLSGTGTIIAPSASAPTTIELVPVEGQGSVVGPVVDVGTTLTLAPISGQGTIVSPTLDVGTTLLLVPVTGQGSIVGPSLTIGTEITLTPVTGQGTVVQPTVAVGWEVVTSPLIGNGSIVAPTASVGWEVSLAPLEGEGSIVDPTIVVTSGAVLSPLLGEGSIVAWTVAVGSEITLTPLSGAGTIVAPVASVASDVVLTPVTGQGSIVNPTAGASINVELTPLSGQGTIVSPVLVVGSAVTLLPLYCEGSIVAPGASYGNVILVPVITATGTIVNVLANVGNEESAPVSMTVIHFYSSVGTVLRFTTQMTSDIRN